MDKIDTILVRVPASTKKELQIIAIKEDTNMSDIIRPLIQEYIEKYNEK